MAEYSRANPSPLYLELLALYREWHAGGHKHFRGGWGGGAHKEIVKLVKQTHSRTILDYGCGKGLHFRDENMSEKNSHLLEELGCEVTGYDPACPPFDTLPEGKFDGVTIIDVAEHLPEEDISWILREIFSFARKFVFLFIALYPARKHFKDGRNVHITLKSERWWRSKVREAKHSTGSRAKLSLLFNDKAKGQQDERRSGQVAEEACLQAGIQPEREGIPSVGERPIGKPGQALHLPEAQEKV